MTKFEHQRAYVAFAVSATLSLVAKAETLISYNLSGTLTATNGAALTLRDFAPLPNVGGSIIFNASIILDLDSTPSVEAATPTLQVISYPSAVKSIGFNLGGYQYDNLRSFYDAPSISPTPSDESAMAVQNSVPTSGLDRLVIETDDYSRTQSPPVPNSSLFNTFSRPVTLVLGGFTYDTMTFRLTETRLDVLGTGFLSSASIPFSSNWAAAAGLRSFTVGLDVVFTGASAPPQRGNAIFASTADLQIVASPVPEPTTALMLLAGLAGLASILSNNRALEGKA